MEIREHAILYALIAKYCLEEAGKQEGERLIREITVLYGTKRGQRMRQKAGENRKVPDINAYMIHGEWQGKPSENSSEMIYESDSTVSRVNKCAWHETWKEYGLQEYGKYYCRYIDQALCSGFGGSFSLRVDQSMGNGDDCCVFVWSQAADERMISEGRKQAAGRYILPFDFHCQELYGCALSVLAENGMTGNTDRIISEFKKLTGVSLMNRQPEQDR